MIEVKEEVVLQILRVEEPVTFYALCKWLHGAKVGEVDQLLWELHRQGRAHREEIEGTEVWFYGAKIN